MISYKHMWRQAELADCNVAICAEGTGKQLSCFPAHKAILSASPYFRAQVVRWASPASGEHATAEGDGQSSHNSRGGNRGNPGTSSAPDGSSTSSDSCNRLPVFTLTMSSQPGVKLQDQVAAAAAVLASDSGSPAAFHNSSDTQLLQAAVTADMLQLDTVCAAAVQRLASRRPLSAAVKRQYFRCTAWPSCLLPLFRRMSRGMPLAAVVEAWCRNCLTDQQQACSGHSSDMLAQLKAAPQRPALMRLLLAQLGDLDRVWRDEGLVKVLLELPLPAVVMLLASDKLQVSSEDNMLYTAQAFLDKQPAGAQKEAARQQLAPLIRCPQLSKLWQLAVVSSSDGDNSMLLSAYRTQLAAYMALGMASPDLQNPSTARDYITDPTCSRWFLAPRQCSPLPDGCVQLQWRLSVAELRAASSKACEKRSIVRLDSSDHLAGRGVTPPLYGICWWLWVECVGQADGSGSKLGVYAVPVGAPTPAYIKYTLTIASPGVRRLEGTTPVLSASRSCGWPDFFDLGVMAGGWDAAAWANKGLPAEGELLLELKVTDVQPRRLRWQTTLLLNYSIQPGFALLCLHGK